MSQGARILGVGQIEAPASAIHRLFLPGPDLFVRRAERLRTLSAGHALGDYLAFLARLTEAQQQALKRFPAVPLPDAGEQALCREHRMPLLGARSWTRDKAWRAGLIMILRQLQQSALPPAARETVEELLHASEAGLEERADKLLAGDLASLPPGELPLVAAALQVYWLHMATGLGEEAFGRLDEGGICPVCGSPPMAGVVRTGGAVQGLRYLCCSLCAAQWHMVRLKCSRCESTEGIDYFILDGSNGAVKAESCQSCGNYLKLLYLEKDTRMEPLADDLATLALDLLMDDAGKTRGGPNLMLHPGGG
jgi:FdhE protein